MDLLICYSVNHLPKQRTLEMMMMMMMMMTARSSQWWHTNNYGGTFSWWNLAVLFNFGPYTLVRNILQLLWPPVIWIMNMTQTMSYTNCAGFPSRQYLWGYTCTQCLYGIFSINTTDKQLLNWSDLCVGHPIMLSTKGGKGKERSFSLQYVICTLYSVFVK